jgi:hypothetical protein
VCTAAGGWELGGGGWAGEGEDSSITITWAISSCLNVNLSTIFSTEKKSEYVDKKNCRISATIAGTKSAKVEKR